MLTAFAGCRKNTVKALYFAVRETAGSFDPQIAADSTARIVARNCFEGLVTPGADGSLLPGAAERWDVSPDGLTYTFYLRQGQKWHITKTAAEALEKKLPAGFSPEVTAADFVFAMRRAADPATGAGDAALLRNVANASRIAAGEAPAEELGAEAVSPYVLRVTLERPQPSFLETLAEPVFLPCNETFFRATGGRYGLLIKYMLSNGAFYMTRFDDTAYRMEKNPDYAGPQPAASDVIWLYTQSGDPAYFESLRTGDLAGGYLTPAQLEAFSPGKRTSQLPLRDMLYGVAFNLADPAAANADLRAAFYRAVDGGALCARFSREPAAAWFPAAVEGGDLPAPVWGAADAAGARESLSLALGALETESVTLTLLCETAYETGVRQQLQDWQKILGTAFNINVESLAPDELARRVTAGDYQMALCPVTAPSARACDWFSMFSAAAGSLTGLADAAYDAAADELFFDAAGAAEEAAGILGETRCFLPLWEDGNTFLCTGDVTGVIVLPGPDRLYLYAADPGRD